MQGGGASEGHATAASGDAFNDDNKDDAEGSKIVHAQGATIEYASPEQLRSLQCQLLPDTHPDIWYNGPAPDLFSAGVVLFEQLTGEMPFPPVVIDYEAPASIPEQHKEKWELYEATRQAHRVWVSLQILLHPMCAQPHIL